MLTLPDASVMRRWSEVGSSMVTRVGLPGVRTIRWLVQSSVLTSISWLPTSAPVIVTEPGTASSRRSDLPPVALAARAAALPRGREWPSMAANGSCPRDERAAPASAESSRRSRRRCRCTRRRSTTGCPGQRIVGRGRRRSASRAYAPRSRVVDAPEVAVDGTVAVGQHDRSGSDLALSDIGSEAGGCLPSTPSSSRSSRSSGPPTTTGAVRCRSRPRRLADVVDLDWRPSRSASRR